MQSLFKNQSFIQKNRTPTLVGISVIPTYEGLTSENFVRIIATQIFLRNH